MQIELNAEELDLIIDWFDVMTELVGSKEVDEELAGRLLKLQSDAKELEDMDFDDCAGGACKL